jgi:hypothetical protein
VNRTEPETQNTPSAITEDNAYKSESFGWLRGMDFEPPTFGL